MSKEPHTTLDLERGGTVDTRKYPFRIAIDPELELPVKDLRYQVSSWTLGRLEKLSRSRMEIGRLSGENLEKWARREDGIIIGIAQSVRASSDIEGEIVYLEKAEIPPFPSTTKEDQTGLSDDEIRRRHMAGEDIYDAYIWALNHEAHEVLSEDFILDLHSRMFGRAYPATAGRFKDTSIAIEGPPYYVSTVSPKRARQYLRMMTARMRHQWALAAEGRYNHFLLAGEYVLDFLAIHPFEDVNGRFARLLSTYLLEKAGYHFPRFYSLDHVIRERRAEYYKSLFDAQNGWMTAKEDLTPWINFYIECVEMQCSRTMENLRRKHLEEARFAGVPLPNREDWISTLPPQNADSADSISEDRER